MELTIGTPAVITTDTLTAGWAPGLAPALASTPREIVVWLGWLRARVFVEAPPPRYRDRYPATLDHSPPLHIHS